MSEFISTFEFLKNQRNATLIYGAVFFNEMTNNDFKTHHIYDGILVIENRMNRNDCE